jgi:hypothetical protein
VGWKFMSQVETDQYHPTLLAALHARTYREAIERLARYKKLCSAEEFRITQKGDEILVGVSWPFAGKEPPPVLLIDAVFALVTELGRRGTKRRLNPKRLELTRQAEPENRFEQYFGYPVNIAPLAIRLFCTLPTWGFPSSRTTMNSCKYSRPSSNKN